MNNLILVKHRDAAEASFRNQSFDDESVDKRESTDADACQVLRGRERNQHEGTTSELDDEELADENADDDENEQVVVGDVAEHVDVIFG